MDFQVAPLPYSKDALEPVMKKETLEYHYEKHHKGYMAKLESLLAGKPEAQDTLGAVIKNSTGAIFNNAAQVYNHTFFWEGMMPGGGGAPPAGDVADLIRRDLGGWEKFREDWAARGMARFGSGYVWLTLSGGKAKITDTPNAETPLTLGDTLLLTTDVWEHAYYLDHRNNRMAFLDVFCDKLINWDFVAKNLKAAR